MNIFLTQAASYTGKRFQTLLYKNITSFEYEKNILTLRNATDEKPVKVHNVIKFSAITPKQSK